MSDFSFCAPRPEVGLFPTWELAHLLQRCREGGMLMPLVMPKRTATLGEVIAALYDQAAECSSSPQEVSRLCTQAIERFLVRSGNVRAARRLARGSKSL